MLEILKKKIKIITGLILISLLTFSFQIASENNKINETEKSLETTSTPVSGKIVILDARSWNTR